jgi:hypothetical protein
MAGRPGFDSRQGQGFFLFATASRAALERTQHRGLFPWGQSGRGVKPTALFSIKIKNAWSYNSIPRTSSWLGTLLRTGNVFMAWCLVKHRGNFTFNFTRIAYFIHSF